MQANRRKILSNLSVLGAICAIPLLTLAVVAVRANKAKRAEAERARVATVARQEEERAEAQRREAQRLRDEEAKLGQAKAEEAQRGAARDAAAAAAKASREAETARLRRRYLASPAVSSGARGVALVVLLAGEPDPRWSAEIARRLSERGVAADLGIFSAEFATEYVRDRTASAEFKPDEYATALIVAELSFTDRHVETPAPFESCTARITLRRVGLNEPNVPASCQIDGAGAGFERDRARALALDRAFNQLTADQLRALAARPSENTATTKL